MRLTKKALITAAATGALAFGAIGGIAAATSPSGATIHACAAKHTGSLRVASHCYSSEHAVTWNAKGPRGAKGAAGATGAAGPTGAPGEQGPRGFTGLPGSTGKFSASDITLVRSTISVAASGQSAAYAFCPSGKVAISGGAGWDGGAANGEYVADSGPVYSGGTFHNTTSGTTPVEWYASMHNLTSSADTAYVWAICA